MKYIVANHKNYLTLDEVLEYTSKLIPCKNNNLIICPSDMFLHLFKSDKYYLGSQYVSNTIPFTGGASTDQLISMGVKYTIVGHSDNRIKQNESNEIVNSKIKSLISYSITPIVCFGELSKASLNDTLSTLTVEINSMLSEIPAEYVNKIIFAYEPVWAINNPDIYIDCNYVDKIASYIKNYFEVTYGVRPSLLYGGSISLSNIDELNKIDSLDGFLIGGASAKVDVFNQILDKIS